MKKTYIYAGIGGWILVLVIIIIGIVGSLNSDSKQQEQPDNFTNLSKMNELVVHPIADDQQIAVKVKDVTLTIDEKTPTYCILGECIEDRAPGKYVLTLTAEITNLSNEEYVDSPYEFKIEDNNGKRYSPMARQFGITSTVTEIAKGESFETRIVYDVDPPQNNYFLILEQYWGDKETRIELNQLTKLRPSLCSGKAECFGGFVTKVIDGDTLDILNVETQQIERIRLSLVDTPEKGEAMFDTAKDFTSGFCPIDSYVLFDEDDGQTEGSFDRIIGKLYCEGKLLNEKLLEYDLAAIDTRFCNVSEYANESWTDSYGC